ncbi:hypothetical protein BH09PAT3_BH09PAT3_0320 [soil metagenome]
MKLFKHYLNFRPFTEQEAWTLFKLAAIAEAIGWTMLIGGILMRNLLLNGNGIPVTIAGHLHGMLFSIYIVAVFALAPSLGWSLPRIIIAGLCSVPPYGTLVYEQISAFYRNRKYFKRLHRLVSYNLASQS